jgi:acetyl-CoA carboxylase carboxyltransferase component
MLVDAVIERSAARARIIDALLMLETKTPANRPAKKKWKYSSMIVGK